MQQVLQLHVPGVQVERLVLESGVVEPQRQHRLQGQDGQQDQPADHRGPTTRDIPARRLGGLPVPLYPGFPGRRAIGRRRQLRRFHRRQDLGGRLGEGGVRPDRNHGGGGRLLDGGGVPGVRCRLVGLSGWSGERAFLALQRRHHDGVGVGQHVGPRSGFGAENRAALLAGLAGRRAVGVRGCGAAVCGRGLARILAATRSGDVDHGVVEDELGAGDVHRAFRFLRIGLVGEGSLDSRRWFVVIGPFGGPDDGDLLRGPGPAVSSGAGSARDRAGNVLGTPRVSRRWPVQRLKPAPVPRPPGLRRVLRPGGLRHVRCGHPSWAAGVLGRRSRAQTGLGRTGR